MTKKPAFDPCEYLARRRFPQAYQSVLPPRDNLTKERQRDFYESQVAAYIVELRTKPPEDLAVLVSAERKKEAEEIAERLKQEEASRFFNRATAQADFSHWSKTAYWTLEEAVALSFGKSPRIVNWKTIETHVGVSPFVVSYRNLRDLAFRAKHMGQLYDPVVPGFYLAWALRMGVQIDPRLIEGVEANGGIVADWKMMFDNEREAHRATKDLLDQQRQELISWAKEEHTRALELGASAVAGRDARIRELEDQLSKLDSEPEQPLRTRERTSLLNLVIGMAVKGYGYKPAASKNSAIPEIASDLHELGLSLSEDTIRKYLNESKELLSGDQTE